MLLVCQLTGPGLFPQIQSIAFPEDPAHVWIVWMVYDGRRY
jgi:hypothetical protein